MLGSAGRRLLAGAALVVLVLAALAGGGYAQLHRVPPPLRVVGHAPAAPTAGAPPDLGVPSGSAEAAMACPELGVFAVTAGEHAVPIASVAKVMTALVILENHPLERDQPGPTLTMTAADVAGYQAAVANEESSVRVVEGERLTLYQLLQGLLIPSANNFARLLATWDAGSVPAFVKKMNDRGARLDFKQTVFADPAGVDPDTRGVPSELARLALEALKQPVLMQIAGQPSAVLPVAGTVYNVDRILGEQGVLGIKTGSGPQFGGNFMFATKVQPAGGKTVDLVGAVLALPTLDDAFMLTERLIALAGRTLGYVKLVDTGTALGQVSSEWAAASPVVSGQAAFAVTWPGTPVTARFEPAGPVRAPLAAGSDAGRLEFRVGTQVLTVDAVTTRPILGPGRSWRLLRGP